MSDLMFPKSLCFLFLLFNVICKLLIKRYRNLSGHVEMIEFKLKIRVLSMSEQKSVISLGSLASVHLDINNF